VGNSPKPHVVVLDDHITPYRVPIFSHLHQEDVDLRVLYCTARLPERQWEIPKRLPYPYEILPNLQIRLRRAPFGEPRVILVNPTLWWRLLHLRPDAVVGYAYSLPTWTAFAYARTTGTPFISWCTDTLHTERFLDGWQRRIRRMIIPRAHACLTPSTAGLARFVYWGAQPDRVRIVPQGPDVSVIQKTVRAIREGEVERGPSDGAVILYVASLTERKGVALLLDAFRRVHAQLPGTRLQLVGEGPLREELAQKIEAWGLGDAVQLVGFVPHTELATWYARADVFVLPTLEDTYAVALAEAAAYGLPIVTTPFAGAAAEVLREGLNGVVIDPRDPEQFAQCIVGILSDKEALARMGGNSIEVARGLGPDVAASRFAEAVNLALG